MSFNEKPSTPAVTVFTGESGSASLSATPLVMSFCALSILPVLMIGRAPSRFASDFSTLFCICIIVCVCMCQTFASFVRVLKACLKKV